MTAIYNLLGLPRKQLLRRTMVNKTPHQHHLNQLPLKVLRRK